jgi:hypothetical protein
VRYRGPARAGPWGTGCRRCPGAARGGDSAARCDETVQRIEPSRLSRRRRRPPASYSMCRGGRNGEGRERPRTFLSKRTVSCWGRAASTGEEPGRPDGAARLSRRAQAAQAV